MTTEPLSRDKLDAIRRREEAATTGPWRVVVDDTERPTMVWRECVSPDHPLDEDPGRDYVYDDCTDGQLHAEPFCREADAEFVAHAREDIPVLLAEVKRLRAELATMTEVARGNKAHVATLMGDYEQLLAERDEARRLATLTSVNENAVAQVLHNEREATRPLLDALREWFEEYSQALGPIGEAEMASHNLTLAHAMMRYEQATGGVS